MSANDILKRFPDGTPIGDWFTDPSVPAADPSFDASADFENKSKSAGLLCRSK